jgi:hypothetical protein
VTATDTLGKPCPNCGAYHDDTFAQHHPNEVEYLRWACSQFDPKRPCGVCGLPVGRLSVGGPLICSWCDCGYPRPPDHFRDPQEIVPTPTVTPDLVADPALAGILAGEGGGR